MKKGKYNILNILYKEKAMELGKVPPHDIEAEQAVLRKYAYR